MSRNPWLLLAALAWLAAAALPANAVAQSTILTPLSPADYELHSSRQLAIAADDSGRVMVAYWAKGPDGQWQLYTVLKSGENIQNYLLPRGDISPNYQITARMMVAGPASGGFHLLAHQSGKNYHWHWQNGHWSEPELVYDLGGGSGQAAHGIALGVDGQPRLSAAWGRLRYFEKQGGQWPELVVPGDFDSPHATTIYADANGALHLFGLYRSRIPRVATLQPGADPAQENSWTFQPTGENPDWTTDVPTSSRSHVLDWPHQQIYAAWIKLHQPFVAWAPVGATSAEQWQTVQIPLPERDQASAFCLRANGYGAVGLLYGYHTRGGDHHLAFRWLSSSGPGEEIPLVRPGTQTESVVFESFIGDSFDFYIDPQGTAHLAVTAVKRGEVPAHRRRVFYATVTGGATATSGPQTTAGGPPAMTQEGPKPDFVVEVAEPGPDHEPYRIGYNRVQLVATVTNQGAEYYGDLWLAANVDGAIARIHIPDTSDHRRPLLERGETKRVYFPGFRYQDEPDPDYSPGECTYEYGKASNHAVWLATGLGRKHIIVTVDPENQVDEAQEDNNSAEREYIVRDGGHKLDRERVGNETIYGFNDLAVAVSLVHHNTFLWLDGYAQRSTTVQAVVVNPRFAGFFEGIPVVFYLDDQEVGRTAIDMVDRAPNLCSHNLGLGDPEGPHQLDLSGAVVEVPLDLTNVSVAEHTLKVVADPEDKFADLTLANNTFETTLKVLPPGGTLRVQVLDAWTNQPVSRPYVNLEGLYYERATEQGVLEVFDVPAGDYSARRLWAQNLYGQPRYARAYAQDNFTITAQQITNMQIHVERPVTIVGDIYDGATGELLTEERVRVQIKDERLPTEISPGHYKIFDVLPGPQVLQAGAYSFQTKEFTGDIHGQGETGECTVDITLQPGPRCTIEGTVTDTNGRAIRGASVWLSGAPRSAETDESGHFLLERVAADRNYAVWAAAKNYLAQNVVVRNLAPGETRTVTVEIAKITSRLKSIDANCITWAEFESWPGWSVLGASSPSFEVSAKFGEFKLSMGLLYRTVAGQDLETIDQLVIGIEPGPFWQSMVSSTWDPADLFDGVVDGITEGISALSPTAGKAIKAYGHLISAADPINTVYDYFTGDLDPQQMHGEAEVIGTYTTHTGAELEDATIIDLPQIDTEIPLGMGFQGGMTVVRMDKVEVTDGEHTKTVWRQWYSGKMAIYNIGEEMDLDNLEVRLYVQVMNQNLSVGPLYANSRNVVTWKPVENRWLRMEPNMYQALPY